jgi:ATP-binding protein involved in chromosome partitioning
MLDPRAAVINKRLNPIKRILVFASSKGGVGKSSCAVVSALLLAEQGHKTALFDLDFHGATDHIFLGEAPSFPEEEGGILPLHPLPGLSFMSIVPFTGEHGVPMRGTDISNAILELMAVTLWGDQEYLIIDMPPGMGDELLDVFKYFTQSELIVISTPSIISRKVVARLLDLVETTPLGVAGVLYNTVAPGNGPPPAPITVKNDVPVLAALTYDPQLEEAVGNPSRLLQTNFARQLSSMLQNLKKQPPRR